MLQGDLTLEDMKRISGDVCSYLTKLQMSPEIICKEVVSDEKHYWAELKRDVLAEIVEKATQLYLAHGGSTISNITKHFRENGNPRCFCGCPNSVKQQ
ncbi:MAG TPA: hypothetical protein VIJ87_08330 [Pyrinomonadaceae bacterium]|jgi:hypothetical protein